MDLFGILVRSFWSRRLISIFARFAFAGFKSLVRYSAKKGIARHFWAITIKAKKGGGRKGGLLYLIPRGSGIGMSLRQRNEDIRIGVILLLAQDWDRNEELRPCSL